MLRIVLDSKTLTKLLAIGQPVEICDESGIVVGQFTPSLDVYGSLDSDLSEQELAELMKETRGRKLADILRDLEASA